MVDWNSVATLLKSADAMYKLVFCLLGLYTWEWWTSLDFEWELLTGRRKFRWPLIFYFLCRYCPLLFLYTFIVFSMSFSMKGPLDCYAIFVMMHVFGNGCVAFATTTLSLRTIALWSDNRMINIGFALLTLGLWALIGAVSKYTAVIRWVPGIGCYAGHLNTKGDCAVFIYTLIFDLISLAFALYKIMDIKNPSLPRRREGQLQYILFTQGIGYFILIAVLDALAVAFFLLDLNQVMVGMLAVPAEVIAPLVVCRMTRALYTFTYDSESQISTTAKSSFSVIHFRSGQSVSTATVS